MKMNCEYEVYRVISEIEEKEFWVYILQHNAKGPVLVISKKYHIGFHLR